MKSSTNRWLMVVVIGISAASFDCNNHPTQENEVARVGDRTLTLEMIRQQIDTSHGISEMQIRMFANRWVNSELLYQEAQRIGIDNSEEVLSSLAEAKKQLAINALLEKEVFSDTLQSVSAEEVAAYYNAHREEFLLPEDVVWISLVVFADRDPATEFRTSVLQHKDQNVVEAWSASEHALESKPSSRQSILTKTDSVFYIQSRLFPAELWKVATALDVGEISFPVKTSAGYFVLLSLGNYKKGIIAPLLYVDDSIRQRILIEKRQQRYTQYLESLRRSHPVQINLGELGPNADTLLLRSNE